MSKNREPEKCAGYLDEYQLLVLEVASRLMGGLMADPEIENADQTYCVNKAIELIEEVKERA